MSKKTLREIELERGFLVPDANAKKLDSPIDEDEIKELVSTGKAVGVNHADRVKFLQDNGYAVTRKNMVDSSLSVSPPPDEDATDKT